MSNYRIQRGDTLSSVAARFHTSVSKLLKANPQLQNANLIRAGATLHIPGAQDDFVASPQRRAGDAAKPSARNVQSVAAHAASAPGNGRRAYDVARQYLGHNISELKRQGTLAPYLDKWPGNTVCCANFVSACLEKAGLIRHSEHNDSVRYLAQTLRRDPNFTESSSLRNAQPGDVVCLNVHGKHYGHVVMFAGWENGKPVFIGSNNANRDGTQRITQVPMNYSVDAVFHHR